LSPLSAFRFTLSSIILYQQTAIEAAQRREGYQDQEAPVPPAIEHVAGRHYQQILPLALLEHKPVEQEHDWQKDQELERIEEHVLFFITDNTNNIGGIDRIVALHVRLAKAQIDLEMRIHLRLSIKDRAHHHQKEYKTIPHAISNYINLHL
jgi:hypothetical protein